tara:strand:+ start:650 stop:1666 length:1017 start_codon:yes stop_codon:yes gene_type:complete
MKTKIHKKFNEFLDEASKPDYAFLDLAHARRRGRVAIIVQKIKDGKEFLTKKGLIVLDKKIEINGVEHDVKSMQQTLEQPGYKQGQVKFFYKGEPMYMGDGKDFYKTPDLGGVAKGKSTAKENMALDAFKKEFQAAMDKEGTPYLNIKVGKRVVKASDIISQPPYRGDKTPKSDFCLLGVDRKTQVGFISHKDGSTARDFLQYGGVSKDKKLKTNKKVNDFLDAVKNERPDGLRSGDAFKRTVKDPVVKKNTVYGPEAGKKPSPYNVDEFHQGPMFLKKKGNTYEIVSNHKIVNPQIPGGDYEPTYVAGFRNNRNSAGIKNARVAVYTKAFSPRAKPV